MNYRNVLTKSINVSTDRQRVKKKGKERKNAWCWRLAQRKKKEVNAARKSNCYQENRLAFILQPDWRILQWTAVTATITNQAGLQLLAGKFLERFFFRNNKIMSPQILLWKVPGHFLFSPLTKCFYGHSWKTEKFHLSFLNWNLESYPQKCWVLAFSSWLKFIF